MPPRAQILLSLFHGRNLPLETGDLLRFRPQSVADRFKAMQYSV